MQASGGSLHLRAIVGRVLGKRALARRRRCCVQPARCVYRLYMGVLGMFAMASHGPPVRRHTLPGSGQTAPPSLPIAKVETRAKTPLDERADDPARAPFR